MRAHACDEAHSSRTSYVTEKPSQKHLFHLMMCSRRRTAGGMCADPAKKLDLRCIIPAREGFRSQGTRTLGEKMKRAVRMLFLMVGLVCTYVAVAAPVIAVRDGGPIPMCSPKKPNCPMVR